MKGSFIMQRIAAFEKVSEPLFAQAWQGQFGSDEGAATALSQLSLPRRATGGSAGYDFFLPFDVTLQPRETVTVPTGIRARMTDGWVLLLYPRSGLGFKYRLQLNNTVGVIDSDYYHSSNEGHIFIKITNDSNEGKVLSLKAGDAFAQGIFTPFGITEDDEADGVRDGGFGSTTRRKQSS
jgi:dUTP pyrophosphatase